MEGLRGNAPLVHLQLTVHNDAPAEPSTPSTRRNSSSSSSGASSYATVSIFFSQWHAKALITRVPGSANMQGRTWRCALF